MAKNEACCGNKIKNNPFILSGINIRIIFLCMTHCEKYRHFSSKLIYQCQWREIFPARKKSDYKSFQKRNWSTLFFYFPNCTCDPAINWKKYILWCMSLLCTIYSTVQLGVYSAATVTPPLQACHHEVLSAYFTWIQTHVHPLVAAYLMCALSRILIGHLLTPCFNF